MRFEVKEQIYQVVVAIDQLANALTGGMTDETISSRCFRLNHKKTYRIAEILINILFSPLDGLSHCEQSYITEVVGRHLPTKFYDLAYEMNLQFDIRRASLISQ
jgi:hypothetical protein